MKLRALVNETNKVVANLDNECKAIENNNQIIRAEKFEKIRDYLMDCYEIVKELGAQIIRVKIDVNVRYLDYPTTTFIEFSSRGKKPISFFYSYINNKGHESYEYDSHYGIDATTKWDADKEHQYFFGCWWKSEDEKAFVDKWNQDKFEKRFAIKVEQAITAKANKANEKYEYVTNNTKLLNEEE